jgi:hypothetical protein
MGRSFRERAIADDEVATRPPGGLQLAGVERATIPR